MNDKMNYKKMLPYLYLLSATSLSGGRIKTYDKIEGIDIKKEYDLITKKQSALSSDMRKLVVKKYNLMYGDKA